MNLKVNWV